MRRVVVDPVVPDGAAVDEAAAVVRRGGVIGFPTDTLYGLAVDPFDAGAVDRLFAVKGRASGQAVALVAADLEQVETWLGQLSATARRLAERFWPGPLTILVKPGPTGNAGLAAPTGDGRDTRSVSPAGSVFHRGPLASGIAAADGTVGVRVPDHAVARALCRACGRPLTATSANLSGESPSADPDEVARALAGRIDLLLDAGRTSGGPPSTLVDASAGALRLVRAGAIEWDTIQQCGRGE